LLDGKVRRGPGFVKETLDNFHLPLLVRENAASMIGRADGPEYA
jgi:hypothetical protein